MNKQELTRFDLELSDVGVEKTMLLKDFVSFLLFLSKNPAKLTATGNLQLKYMDEMARFIEAPSIFIEHGYRIRSQQEWVYLDILVVLASVAGFTRKRKNKKFISFRGKEFLTALPTTQFGDLFLTYWKCLNWGYLFQYGERDENHPAYILQRSQERVLDIIRDYQRNQMAG